MRGGGASSSRGGGSPGSAARALEAAEERLREALADGLAQVSFRLINSSLSELTYFYFFLLIFNLFCSERSLRLLWPRSEPRRREITPSGLESVLNGSQSGPHSLLR